MPKFIPKADRPTEPRYIDCTPTWVNLLPVMLQLISERNDQPDLFNEFLRMAAAADNWNAHCKQEQADQEAQAKEVEAEFIELERELKNL